MRNVGRVDRGCPYVRCIGRLEFELDGHLALQRFVRLRSTIELRQLSCKCKLASSGQVLWRKDTFRILCHLLHLALKTLTESSGLDLIRFLYFLLCSFLVVCSVLIQL